MLQKRSRILSANPSGKRFRQIRNLLSAVQGNLPGIFPVFLLFLFIFLVFNLFAIRKVDCVFNNNPCPPEVQEKLSRYLGSNILLVNHKSLTSSIKTAFPIEKMTIGFKVFNTLKIKIDGRLSALNMQVSLMSSLPELDLDKSIISTESANFLKPTDEIEALTQEVQFVSFDLWDTGLMSTTASSESKIKYFFTDKPSVESLQSLYALIKLVDRYLDVSGIMILNNRVFLRQTDQPDIIVNIPFEEEVLVQALQSFTYLTTIKKDAKVIDLRFKNPILR